MLLCRSFTSRSVAFGRHIALALQFFLFVGLLSGCGSQTTLTPLEQADVAMQAGDIKTARSLAKSIPRDSSAWADAQVFLGDVATASRSMRAGLPYYESVPLDGSQASIKASRAIAEIHAKEGALQIPIERFRFVSTQKPDEMTIHQRLAGLLFDAGLRAEAEQHILEIVQHGRIEIKDFVQMTEPGRPNGRIAYLQQCLRENGRDPYINLGLASEFLSEKRADEALAALTIAIEVMPELGPAQALRGEIALDRGPGDLQSWYRQLPSVVMDDPGVWYVLGLWSRQLKEDKVAARCFWETVRRRPIHHGALFQLGQVLAPIDQAAAAAFTQRAADMREYAQGIEHVLIQHGRDEIRMKRIIELLRGMGREWEAYGWLTLARDQFGPDGWPGPLLQELSHLPTTDAPRFQPDRDLSLKYDLSTYPGFDAILQRAVPELTSVPSTSVSSSQIRFAERATELGVDFTYFQGPDTRSKGVRIFESTGGGIGVLDLDLDGQPDLYMTQGEPWESGSSHPSPTAEYRDQLFRGTRDRFQDITDLAGLGIEDGYSQGCSVGDFNNDGFPDLYVGNIGVNQLLMNNGDGTFTDVTVEAGISVSKWTTSCLLMDLNADGAPDLYDVNYLQGENMFNVECHETRCSVRDYEGAPDVVLLSKGDGTFELVDNATPTATPKGLGIVALFLAGEQCPSLFIANDQVPNFFLRPTSVDGVYEDQALLSGLALNMEGQTTACMGVASGDVNHDRMTDLFVTNFEGEANNLYLQRSNGFFEDSIRGRGQLSAGIPYVRWGTQFIDADNDSELDLVVASGHVADFGQPQVQYKMPTQMLRNVGQMQFQLLSPSEAGALFEREMLGRSVATIDWNQDGRLDFVQSSIAAPLMIATNESTGAGHFLSVRLHAQAPTARDAFGTVVEVKTERAAHWQQLIAGSGYQASNQRELHFGLGTSETLVSVTIHWPSGQTDLLDAIPVDTTLEVVEGSPRATLWKNGEPSAR